MNEVVWSVNILLAIGLLGTVYVLYYILTLDNRENVSVQNQEDQQSD
jgi:hypothetical protein